jgi:hypothetical protein
LVVISANAATQLPASTQIAVTDAGSGSDCVLAFASGTATSVASNCTSDLFGGKVVYPGPADVTITGTLNGGGTATLANVNLGVNSGNSRGVVWFQRDSLARITQPTTGHLGAVSSAVATGDILLTPPGSITTPLNAMLVAWFDENSDGILQAGEVVSADVKLGTDTQMSTIFTPAQAATLLAALESSSVSYVLAAVVQSPTGDLQRSTSIAVKASLSFTATAAITK